MAREALDQREVGARVDQIRDERPSEIVRAEFADAGLRRTLSADEEDGGGTISRLLDVYSGRINEHSDLGIVWKTSVIDKIVDAYDDPVQ